MAAEDLANMPVAKTDAPRTADDTITDFDGEGHVDLDAVNAAAAAEAGVRHASYVGYDDALNAYASRSDIEDLAHKNARDMPAEFSDAAFMRSTTSSQWDNTLDNTDVAGPLEPDYDGDGTYEGSSEGSTP